MKLSSSKQFLEKGYGVFPYIIIRKFSAIYQQFPIHREEHDLMALDGIVIYNEDLEKSEGYHDACKKMFLELWKQEFERDNPLDMCLVLNSSLAFYIDKEGKVGQAGPPSGGILLSQDGKIIQMEGRHFIIDY